MVTNKAIRPGTMFTGIMNPMNEMMVNIPLGPNVFSTCDFGERLMMTENPV